MVTTNLSAPGAAGGPPIITTSPPNASMETASSTRRSTDNRRSNKPIMEKRRRARINNSLNELKTLILDALKKDPARHSKLEKADILEMTVKHLQNLQRQHVATDPTVVSKFRAGFTECASEVGRFPGLEPLVRRRLLQHLATCLGAVTTTNNNNNNALINNNNITKDGLVVSGGPAGSIPSPNGSSILLTGSGVQLVPTRLPNGDIALVLPATAQVASPPISNHSASATPTTLSPQSSPLPLLVPIPHNRSAITAVSPRALAEMDYQPRPLSLVVRRNDAAAPADDDIPVDEKPWRPWH